MKIHIVGEYREQFTSKIAGKNFNPHPSYSNILDIQNACEEKQIECSYFGGVRELIHAIDINEQFDSDILFLNISDGLTQSYCRIQAPVLFELLGVQYTGSTPFVVGLMNNKHYTKLALKKFFLNDIKFPNDIILTNKNVPKQTDMIKLTYPVIIKPNNDGFSMGIDNLSICYNYSEMLEKISTLQKDYDEILIEEYISGIDLSVFIIGNNSEILINEAIVYKTYGSFYQESTVRDIYAKANKLSEKHSAKEVLSQDLIQILKNVSADIFRSLNARDIARIDYRIDRNNQIYFLEINANPILASGSDAEIVCKNLNISYADLILTYIKTAMNRYQ